MSEPAPASRPMPTTEGSSFEALFVHVLSPQGAFARELLEAGFDPKRMQPRYPSEIWYRCLDVARRHTYPELPPDRGFRELGRTFMEGYFNTLIGKVIGAALPFYGLQRTLEKLPRVWKSSQPHTEVTVDKVGDREWRVTIRSVGIIPEFSAGLMEAAAAPVGDAVTIDVLEHSAVHAVLRVVSVKA